MIPLAQARKLAERIAAELEPFSAKIEIAGSIRRGKPDVGDIDLVIVPSNSAALRERIFKNPGTARVLDGETNIIARLGNGIQLDIFLARPDRQDLFSLSPSNFGSLLLCRTGSRAHNIYLIEHAKKLGLTWNPYYGIYDKRGECLAGRTEQEIFERLNLPFIPPESRDR